MRNIKLAIIVLGFMLCSAFLIMPIGAQDNLLTEADPYLYAGYYFYNGEVNDAFGVSGKIYTISPAVPGINHFAQWVNVMISYRNHYWIQMGYIKDLLHRGLIPVFHIEVNDAWSHRFRFISTPKPQVGVTYKYIIIPAYEDGKWDCIILRGESVIFETTMETNPFDCDDVQAFTETTIGEINIVGTHFSELSYFNGRGFPLWDHHVPRADSPYYLKEKSHYEFYAYGGG